MAEKPMKLEIMPSEIMGTEIMKSGEHRYARVGAKRSDNEYISISYEWKGDGTIPEFVLGLMSFISSSENKEEISKLRTECKTEYEEFNKRLKNA